MKLTNLRLLALATAALLHACGGGGGGGNTTPPVTTPPVTPAPSISGFTAAPSSIVAGNSVTFTATASNATCSINFGDGSSAPVGCEGGNTAHAYNTAGTYTATLTASGNGSTTRQVSVTVTPANPMAGICPDGNIAPNGAVNTSYNFDAGACTTPPKSAFKMNDIRRLYKADGTATNAWLVSNPSTGENHDFIICRTEDESGHTARARTGDTTAFSNYNNARITECLEGLVNYKQQTYRIIITTVDKSVPKSVLGVSDFATGSTAQRLTFISGLVLGSEFDENAVSQHEFEVYFTTKVIPESDNDQFGPYYYQFTKPVSGPINGVKWAGVNGGADQVSGTVPGTVNFKRDDGLIFSNSGSFSAAQHKRNPFGLWAAGAAGWDRAKVRQVINGQIASYVCNQSTGDYVAGNYNCTDVKYYTPDQLMDRHVAQGGLFGEPNHLRSEKTEHDLMVYVYKKSEAFPDAAEVVKLAKFQSDTAQRTETSSNIDGGGSTLHTAWVDPVGIVLSGVQARTESP